MPLSLTCDCGARFELEEALAGQSVSCPECQQVLVCKACSYSYGGTDEEVE